MTHASVVDKLTKTIAPLVKSKVALDESTQFTGQMELDSLQIMDLMLAVEDEFDISIPLNVLADVRTIGDLAREIEQQMGES
ncbi:MAG: acyl carrier protein [Rhodanobacter sp.]